MILPPFRSHSFWFEERSGDRRKICCDTAKSPTEISTILGTLEIQCIHTLNITFISNLIKYRKYLLYFLNIYSIESQVIIMLNRTEQKVTYVMAGPCFFLSVIPLVAKYRRFCLPGELLPRKCSWSSKKAYLCAILMCKIIINNCINSRSKPSFAVQKHTF